MASSVTLNGIALDIDPETYLINSPRRGSVHKILDGGTVYQDRGVSESDIVVTMTGQLINLTTLQALYSLYRKTNTEFAFSDFKGNTFQVVFRPGAESFNFQPIRGSNRAYTFTIILGVVSVTKWFDGVGSFPSSV